MATLDSDDIAEALHAAALFGARRKARYSSNVPVVASDRSVRSLRHCVEAFIEQLPPDLTLGELLELLNPNHDGDDE